MKRVVHEKQSIFNINPKVSLIMNNKPHKKENRSFTEPVKSSVIKLKDRSFQELETCISDESITKDKRDKLMRLISLLNKQSN